MTTKSVSKRKRGPLTRQSRTIMTIRNNQAKCPPCSPFPTWGVSIMENLCTMLDKRIDELKGLFLEKGLKLTHQRLEILKELSKAKDHPSAEMIHLRVKHRLPTLSLDTVYRTLLTFEKLGFLFKVPAKCPEARFDADLSPHHHFVCTDCRRIIDVDSEPLETESPDRLHSDVGRVDRHEVVYHGLCSHCLDKRGVRAA